MIVEYINGSVECGLVTKVEGDRDIDLDQRIETPEILGNSKAGTFPARWAGADEAPIAKSAISRITDSFLNDLCVIIFPFAI
jgi:hypothetical protein